MPPSMAERGRLRLSVQYAVTAGAPSRARVRRLVAAALAMADDLRPATLTVRFVGEAEGRSLNAAHRGRDRATNVLTFPYGDAHAIEGDVAICMPVVAREARAQRKAVMAHAAHLVVHGALHASGHVHDGADDAEAMEAIERAVLARFRIADPY